MTERHYSINTITLTGSIIKLSAHLTLSNLCSSCLDLFLPTHPWCQHCTFLEEMHIFHITFCLCLIYWKPNFFPLSPIQCYFGHLFSVLLIFWIVPFLFSVVFLLLTSLTVSNFYIKYLVTQFLDLTWVLGTKTSIETWLLIWLYYTTLPSSSRPSFLWDKTYQKVLTLMWRISLMNCKCQRELWISKTFVTKNIWILLRRV